MSHQASAKVETLTAEVRVLMVGNRQVTKSVYLQLDYSPPWRIAPFGRVNTGLHIQIVDHWGSREKEPVAVEVIGREIDSEELVRSYLRHDHYRRVPQGYSPEHWNGLKERWVLLPLIVLAGLR